MRNTLLYLSYVSQIFSAGVHLSQYDPVCKSSIPAQTNQKDKSETNRSDDRKVRFQVIRAAAAAALNYFWPKKHVIAHSE